MSELKVYDYSEEELTQFQYAVINTDHGAMNIKLFVDETPNTVANFAYLAKEGFYNNLNFHRVIPGFVAQGGCPHGTGTGGPGWSIACETDQESKHAKGALSMAHAGPNTGGSQFFVCYDALPHLDGVHTVFGAIDPSDEESMKVLDSINQDDNIISIDIKESL
ncbi:peptidylprolyl isomerase [Sulfurospirillum arcachonense]|uniref:peptidylprolyl isomerase n=1 Tax=Sulfurospirillum arcachonense TaxID=57666 RepID=UPI00046939CF|nr:peptidylprolyl isomerase [Sulfurospirillum arcachonense]